MNEIRSLHVIAGLAARYGGPSYSVPQLCVALNKIGLSAKTLSVRSDEEIAAPDTPTAFRFAQDHKAIPLLSNLRLSRALLRELLHQARHADLIHSHGLWLAPNYYASAAARRAGVPIMISPRGMLAKAALHFSPLRKKLSWWAWQSSSLQRADCLHATAPSEHDEFREMGLSNPIAVIANGIDLPEIAPATRSVQGPLCLLYLGRVHAKKGLEDLLGAWALVERDFPNWRLRIVGPAEDDHDKALRRLSHSLGVERVSIEGPAFGEAKLGAYRDADLFVLPSRNENFGITVAEALAACVPVISTKGAPWSGLASQGCGWWIDHGVGALEAGLRTAMSLSPEERAAMGRRGRTWMQRDFSWERAALEMGAVYTWLLQGGDAPSTVRTM